MPSSFYVTSGNGPNFISSNTDSTYLQFVVDQYGLTFFHNAALVMRGISSNSPLLIGRKPIYPVDIVINWQKAADIMSQIAEMLLADNRGLSISRLITEASQRFLRSRIFLHRRSGMDQKGIVSVFFEGVFLYVLTKA